MVIAQLFFIVDITLEKFDVQRQNEVLYVRFTEGGSIRRAFNKRD